MHEKSPLLTAEKRERTGTRYAERDRKRGRLPAIVYGHGRAPLPITIDAHSALGLIAKGEKVFRLDFPGHQEADEMQMVLLKDVQFDYMGSRIVHCDFARVDLNERVHTRVHINLVGEAKGLKIAGNLLMHPVTEIEIECRVMDIPDHIDVDISNLDEGGVITAGDVKLPQADMKLVSDSHGVVAQIVQGVELKAAEATTVAAEGAASPEVITAKKEDAKGPAAPAAAKGTTPAAGAKPGGDAKGGAPKK
jgi:large subunit ribosomal protein L25